MAHVTFTTIANPTSDCVATTRRASIAPPRTWISACAVFCCLIALVGCTTARKVLPSPPPITQPHRISLNQLAVQLRDDLRDTQIEVDILAVSSQTLGLRIVVPQPDGFDLGSAAVKPELAAVLDLLVNGLKINPRWLVQVSGPIDPRNKGSQGQDRASAVRDYLVMRGISAPRFEPPRGQLQPSTDLLLVDRSPRP
jgi:hypothetical protein